MSTIKSFEDILAWQKARELSRLLEAILMKADLKRISVCSIKSKEAQDQ